VFSETDSSAAISDRDRFVGRNRSTHLRRIYAKLGADDRSAAVQRARELRLLSADRTHPGGARLLDVIAAHREGAHVAAVRRDARAHSGNMPAAHIRHFMNSGCPDALALPGKSPRPSARSALFMITVKTHAYRPHFYREKIVSAIMEVAARRFGGQVLIWVICAQGAPVLWPSLQARNRRSARFRSQRG
jgi:hypothetical protein